MATVDVSLKNETSVTKSKKKYRLFIRFPSWLIRRHLLRRFVWKESDTNIHKMFGRKYATFSLVAFMLRVTIFLEDVGVADSPQLPFIYNKNWHIFLWKVWEVIPRFITTLPLSPSFFIFIADSTIFFKMFNFQWKWYQKCFRWILPKLSETFLILCFTARMRCGSP